MLRGPHRWEQRGSAAGAGGRGGVLGGAYTSHIWWQRGRGNGSDAPVDDGGAAVPRCRRGALLPRTAESGGLGRGSRRRRKSPRLPTTLEGSERMGHNANLCSLTIPAPAPAPGLRGSGSAACSVTGPSFALAASTAARAHAPRSPCTRTPAAPAALLSSPPSRQGRPSRSAGTRCSA